MNWIDECDYDSIFQTEINIKIILKMKQKLTRKCLEKRNHVGQQTKEKTIA